MSDEEPYSRGGLIGDGKPAYLVPDDQLDGSRWDQVAHSEPIIRGCCGEVVPALEFYAGRHTCLGRRP